MDQLLTFITQHWILSTIFALLLLALMVNEWINQSGAASKLSPEETVHWVNHKEGVIIDIRDPQAFSDGHILGSVNIPSQSFEKKLGLLDKFREQPLIVVCASGQNSSKIVAQLKLKGFRAVILGGGLQAWRNASLPLSKK